MSWSERCSGATSAAFSILQRAYIFPWTSKAFYKPLSDSPAFSYCTLNGHVRSRSSIVCYDPSMRLLLWLSFCKRSLSNSVREFHSENGTYICQLLFFPCSFLVFIAICLQKITVFPHRDGDVRSILCEARQQFRFSENGTNILRFSLSLLWIQH